MRSRPAAAFSSGRSTRRSTSSTRSGTRRRCGGSPRRRRGALVTGQPAIQHDLEPVLSSDLRRGEAIALPIALLILFAVLGVSAIVADPVRLRRVHDHADAHRRVRARAAVPDGELRDEPRRADRARARRRLLAADRLALPRGARPRRDVDDGDRRTMADRGPVGRLLGITVAIGLALLLLVPVPFVRSIGVGGFVVPLASIAAASTLQPALLSFAGRRGARRVPVAAFLRSRLGLPLPQLRGTVDVDNGFWARFARDDHAPPGRLSRRRHGDHARARGAGVLPPRHARLDLGAAVVPGVGSRAHASAQRRGCGRADADAGRRRHTGRRRRARHRRSTPRSSGSRTRSSATRRSPSSRSAARRRTSPPTAATRA